MNCLKGTVCVYLETLVMCICMCIHIYRLLFFYTGRDTAFEEIVSDFKLYVKGSCQRNGGIQFQFVQEQGN